METYSNAEADRIERVAISIKRQAQILESASVKYSENPAGMFHQLDYVRGAANEIASNLRVLNRTLDSLERSRTASEDSNYWKYLNASFGPQWLGLVSQIDSPVRDVEVVVDRVVRSIQYSAKKDPAMKSVIGQKAVEITADMEYHLREFTKLVKELKSTFSK
jgi:hypothetical protein